MKKAMWTLIVLCVVALIGYGASTPAAGPYDASADPEKEIQAGLKRIGGSRYLLVIFGANWCGDCLALDQRMKKEPLKSLLEERFEVVKVDVGEWDRNRDVVSWFGNPIQKGIPSIVILDANNVVINQTDGGQLANVRRQSEQATYEYLKSLIPKNQK